MYTYQVTKVVPYICKTIRNRLYRYNTESNDRKCINNIIVWLKCNANALTINNTLFVVHGFTKL